MREWTYDLINPTKICKNCRTTLPLWAVLVALCTISTETVLLILPFLQTNITSQVFYVEVSANFQVLTVWGVTVKCLR